MKDKELYKEDQVKQVAYEEDREYEGCQCEEEEQLELTSEEKLIDLEVQKEYLRIQNEIPFDNESLESIINSQEFQKGCIDAAYLCGYYTSLINSGLSNTQAYELIINAQTCNHNMSLQKENNKVSIEIAKINAIQSEKVSI